MAVNKKIGQDATINVKVKYTGNVRKTLYVFYYMYDKWATYKNYLVGVKSATFVPGEEKTVSLNTEIPAFYAIGRYACNSVKAEVWVGGTKLDSESNTCAVNVLPGTVELYGYMKEFCLCKGVDTSTKPWKPIDKTTTFGKHDKIYVFIHAYDVYFPKAYDVLRATATCVPEEKGWIPATTTLKWYPDKAGRYYVYGYIWFAPPSEGWPSDVHIWAQLDFSTPVRAHWKAKITD